MKTYADASSAVATGDTVETTIGTLTLSAKARRIVGVWCHAVAGAGLTTLENMTGIFRLSSGDLDISPAKYPLDCVGALTSGAFALNPRIFPVNIPVKGGEQIECFVTMDMAITIANKARWGLIYEGD